MVGCAFKGDERMRLILLGPPGAGKGTQAAKIVNKYKIPHISTGEIFRQNIKSGTELGKIAKSYIDKGMLVPDEIAVDIVKKRLIEQDCANGFLLDGFPRNDIQADELDNVLRNLDIMLDKVVNIHVDNEILIERVVNRRVCSRCGQTYHLLYNPPKESEICDACGGSLYQREDDTIETVTRRLEIYHDLTKPLIDYYKNRGILVTIDGLQQIDVVFNDIADALGSD